MVLITCKGKANEDQAFSRHRVPLGWVASVVGRVSA